MFRRRRINKLLAVANAAALVHAPARYIGGLR